jgi:hypothetical protein
LCRNVRNASSIRNGRWLVLAGFNLNLRIPLRRRGLRNIDLRASRRSSLCNDARTSPIFFEDLAPPEWQTEFVMQSN